MATKKRKYPKRPKMTASLDAWKSWEKRASEVKRFNDAIERDKKAKQNIAKKFTR